MLSVDPSNPRVIHHVRARDQVAFGPCVKDWACLWTVSQVLHKGSFQCRRAVLGSIRDAQSVGQHHSAGVPPDICHSETVKPIHTRAQLASYTTLTYAVSITRKTLLDKLLTTPESFLMSATRKVMKPNATRGSKSNTIEPMRSLRRVSSSASSKVGAGTYLHPQQRHMTHEPGRSGGGVRSWVGSHLLSHCCGLER